MKSTSANPPALRTDSQNARYGAGFDCQFGERSSVDAHLSRQHSFPALELVLGDLTVFVRSVQVGERLEHGFLVGAGSGPARLPSRPCGALSFGLARSSSPCPRQLPERGPCRAKLTFGREKATRLLTVIILTWARATTRALCKFPI